MQISIVAISYNEAEHLEFWKKHHATLGDEFILCDTGSSDETERVAKELEIPFFKIEWYHDFARAKNTALRFAKAEWVLFLSPDYWLHPDNFEMIREAVKNAKPETKGFWTPTQMVAEFGKLDELPLTKNIDRADLIKNAHCVLFRNDPLIYYRHKVHENVHEVIIERFGNEALEILPALRYHHSPEKVSNNPDKLRYYWSIEDMVAMEKNFGDWQQFLRITAYKNEI